MAMLERIKHYRIKRKIGSGGMATVYEAIDARNQARVALKVLHPHLADQPAFVARFQREAQMAMNLHSPHIVRILEYGVDQGLHYLAMEYVAGITLQQFIQQTGAVAVNQALSITYQAALALEEANRRGIVHRDIKPHNIMILPNGMIKVMDFGIARDVMMDSMTMTGMFVGTPHYSSPEQAGGERVDVRSDIYSLGVVLYQLLTGAVPFQADTPQALLLRVMQGNPVPVQSLRIDLPAPVVQIVDKMLQRDPDRRYRNPTDLVAAVAALLGSPQQEDARSEMATLVAPLVARMPTPTPEPWPPRRPVLFAVGGVAAVAVLTALVIVLWQPWRSVSGGTAPTTSPAPTQVGATPSPVEVVEKEGTSTPERAAAATTAPPTATLESPTATPAPPSATPTKPPSPTPTKPPSPTSTKPPSPTSTKRPSPTPTKRPSPTPTKPPTATPAPRLAAPTLVEPANGDTRIGDVVLKWQSVAGAKGYEVQTRSDREGQRGWRSWPTDANELRLVFDATADYFREPGTVYYWRVAARDAANKTAAFSQERSWVFQRQSGSSGSGGDKPPPPPPPVSATALLWQGETPMNGRHLALFFSISLLSLWPLRRRRTK